MQTAIIIILISIIAFLVIPNRANDRVANSDVPYSGNDYVYAGSEIDPKQCKREQEEYHQQGLRNREQKALPAPDVVIPMPVFQQREKVKVER